MTPNGSVICHIFFSNYRDFIKPCDQREHEGAERLRPLRRGVREPKTTSEMGPFSQVLGTSGVGNGWS